MTNYITFNFQHINNVNEYNEFVEFTSFAILLLQFTIKIKHILREIIGNIYRNETM